jgi:hypothetical protein
MFRLVMPAVFQTVDFLLDACVQGRVVQITGHVADFRGQFVPAVRLQLDAILQQRVTIAVGQLLRALVDAVDADQGEIRGQLVMCMQCLHRGQDEPVREITPGAELNEDDGCFDGLSSASS